MNRENMVLPPKNWPLIYRFYGEGLPHGLLKAGKESSCKFFKLFSVIKYVKTALKSFMSIRVTLFCKKFSESRGQAFFPFLRS